MSREGVPGLKTFCPGYPPQGAETLRKQLFATKSIDKLISDSELPEHSLKKTLGPVSLTALGIGAVIGSGIFTVVGTAIAGEKFDTSSIVNTPLLDYLVNHHALSGRPGTGPALAVSIVLVAIVCAFTGLCYAELASMIPIAGSAYTYTYATMGELIAWIIGWDLILEYAVSNMAVSVGFAAHIVDLMDWFGLHPSARWISPAFLPSGLADLQGNTIYTPGWHLGFNVPAFLVVVLITVILVRGIRESVGANNVMVVLKVAAILIFLVAGAHFVHPANWHPFYPSGWSGVLTGGSIIFFTYIGFDSVSTAAEECRRPQRDSSHRHSGYAGDLHPALCRSLDCAHRPGSLADASGRCGAGGQHAEEALPCNRIRESGLGKAGGAFAAR